MTVTPKKKNYYGKEPVNETRKHRQRKTKTITKNDTLTFQLQYFDFSIAIL